jgi:hypothetical protein
MIWKNRRSKIELAEKESISNFPSGWLYLRAAIINRDLFIGRCGSNWGRPERPLGVSSGAAKRKRLALIDVGAEEPFVQSIGSRNKITRLKIKKKARERASLHKRKFTANRKTLEAPLLQTEPRRQDDTTFQRKIVNITTGWPLKDTCSTVVVPVRNDSSCTGRRT